MVYIEAIEEVDDSVLSKGVSIFLGGGITACGNWQNSIRQILERECSNDVLSIINPRRANFDTSKTGEAEKQIIWEHSFLRKATAILFWFPSETLCPITLYELGTWSAMSPPKPIFVGCHPDYKRKEDVKIQTKLIRPEVEVQESIEQLAAQVVKWTKNL